MSIFDSVSLAPPDPIFGLDAAFNKDPRIHKVNFLVGVYRDEEGKTPVMQVVRKAEEAILQKEESKTYLPIDGNREFVWQIGKLVFGEEFWEKEHFRMCGVQTLGATGALRLFADFFKQENPNKVWVSSPTWLNHIAIFRRSGYEVEEYFYCEKGFLDFDRLVADLKKLPPKSLVILQPNSHNPTGMDLNESEWKILSQLFLKKQLFPFFDAAYHGFGRDLDKDLFGVRYFAEQGHEMAVAYSCSKNFGLYGERVGALFVLAFSAKFIENIRSQMKVLIRTNYSNPPKHGSFIVSEVLSSKNLKEEWREELEKIRKRMFVLRTNLAAALKICCPKIDFTFIENGVGLFSLFNLQEKQIKKLVDEYGIYLTKDGRMNLTGLNEKNFSYVLRAFSDLSLYE
ncbi:MAG: aromatic amino acid transaminase [Chlamydiae bacterium]|nr:aromatic amino acid transaminase [Chlamydiota bacterium]